MWPGLLAGVLLAAGVILWMNLRLSPLIRSYAGAALQSRVGKLVNQILAQELGGGEYPELITLEKTEEGQVAALRCNMGEANLLRAQVVDTLNESLAQKENQVISIPMGSLTGVNLLSGRGPRVPIEVQSYSVVEGELGSSLEAAAVNQSHYRLELEIRVSATLLLPTGSKVIPLETSVTIAEAVLLGQVPESYTVFDNYASGEEAAEDYFDYG
jgi:sporulation protein YunB